MPLIQDIFYEAVQKYGSRTAFDSGNDRITFDRLWERVSYIAGALSVLGIRSGERIGILSGNCTDYIVYHYAAATIGAILLVLNTRHTGEELIWALDDAEASALIISASHQALLTEIADREKLTFPALRYIIGAGGAGPGHAERMRVFCERFDCRYMGIYGQTEVTGPATVITGEDYFSKPYSCGKPMREIDLQIWDEMKRPAPAGTVGEIMIRSKTCIPGYWNRDMLYP